MLVEVTFILFSKIKLAQVYYLASQRVLYATSALVQILSAYCLIGLWVLLLLDHVTLTVAI